jgi:hypothetical protein
MKKFLFFLLSAIVSFTAYSQKYPISGFQNNVSSIEKELNHLTQNKESRFEAISSPSNRTSSTLDSVIYYAFDSPEDSALSEKGVYQWSQSGKREKITRLKWDSESQLWNNYRKTEFSYNSNDSLLVIQQFTWYSGIGKWIYTDRREYTYDENGYHASATYLDWRESSQEWIKWFMFEFINDENGNRLESYSYYPDDNNEWEPGAKGVMTYNADNLMTEAINSMWDKDSQEYIPDIRYTYTYSNENHLELLLAEKYFEGDWNSFQKWIYSYTSSGDPEQTVKYYFNGQSWVESEKAEFTFDEHHNMTIQVDYLWVGNQWENKSRWDWEYDANHNETHEWRRQWDNSEGKWINDFKGENAFNGESQPTLYSAYDWNETSEKWAGIYKDVYTYNDHGDIFSYTTYKWREDKDEWYLFSRGYYFHTPSTSIFELSTHSLRIYPNPVSHYISIEGVDRMNGEMECSILSTSGTIVKRINLSQTIADIDVGDLAPGLYLLTIDTGSAIITKKIIKQ